MFGREQNPPGAFRSQAAEELFIHILSFLENKPTNKHDEPVCLLEVLAWTKHSAEWPQEWNVFWKWFRLLEWWVVCLKHSLCCLLILFVSANNIKTKIQTCWQLEMMWSLPPDMVFFVDFSVTRQIRSWCFYCFWRQTEPSLLLLGPLTPPPAGCYVLHCCQPVMCTMLAWTLHSEGPPAFWQGQSDPGI